MKTDTVKIATLIHPPYNPRKAVKRGSPLFEQIRNSIEKFGAVQPPVINRRNNHIVGGNQRITVMKALGIREVDVTFVTLDDNAERELNLALNKIGEDNWHQGKLAALLSQLKDTSDLEILGFDAPSLVEILKQGRAALKGRPDDPAPPPPIKPWVKPGDIFTLHIGGSAPLHRLMCGDSTEKADMRKLTDGTAPHLIFTDPPYGVAYQGTGKNLARKDLQGDLEAGAPLRKMLAAMFSAAMDVAAPTAPLYCFYASRTHREFEDALNMAGWTVRQQIIWTKQMALGRSDYHWAHEPCLYASQSAGRGTWRGDRIETTVWKEAQPNLAQMSKTDLLVWIEQAFHNATAWEVKRDSAASYIHPTQKPTALAARAIKNHLTLKEAVLDFCGGSGSTMIAASEAERPSFTMEKDPAFAQAILGRFHRLYDGATITQNGKTVPPAKLL